MYSAMYAMITLAVALAGPADAEVQPEWETLHAIEKIPRGYRVTGVHPWMMTEKLATPVPAGRHCLVLEIESPHPISVQLYWLNEGQNLAESRSVRLPFPKPAQGQIRVVDLNENGEFSGLTRFRFGPIAPPGTVFEIKRIEFVPIDAVDPRFLPELIKFRCFTSKLHYLPGERIEYRATLNAAAYPDRESSKILSVTLENATGRTLASDCRQYGLRSSSRFKEIQTVLDAPGPLPPGKYRLSGTSTDQRSGLVLRGHHDFVVQATHDPFVCETPFKFV